MFKKINLEKIVYILLLIIMIGLPVIKLLSYILSTMKIIKDSFIFNEAYILWLSIPILFVIYILGLITHKYKLDKLDIIIYILIILGALSTIFAININTSIFGFDKRNEGLLSLYSYYLIFLNIKNINKQKYKNNIIKLFVLLGVIQTIHAFLQVYTNFSFIKHFPFPYLGMGLCGNPNFFGSYMVLLLLMMTTFYLLKNEKKYLILSIIFFIGLCLAGSTGPFLGFLLSFIFFLIYYRKRINFKKTFKLVLIMIVFFFTINISTEYIHEEVFGNEVQRNYSIRSEVIDCIKFIFKIERTEDINNYRNLGNGRVDIWLNLLPLTKDYWPLGAGLDNIAYIYPQKQNVKFDKAHNVYLQILLTNGVFALMAYCLLCLIIFVKGFKLKNDFGIALFIAFIGYCIQAFVNISVIGVAPYFFIILGLLSNEEKSNLI